MITDIRRGFQEQNIRDLVPGVGVLLQIGNARSGLVLHAVVVEEIRTKLAEESEDHAGRSRSAVHPKHDRVFLGGGRLGGGEPVVQVDLALAGGDVEVATVVVRVRRPRQACVVPAAGSAERGAASKQAACMALSPGSEVILSAAGAASRSEGAASTSAAAVIPRNELPMGGDGSFLARVGKR